MALLEIDDGCGGHGRPFAATKRPRRRLLVTCRSRYNPRKGQR
ncbi:Hypothetical protein A7982_01934 [Minicystis rosea]|nr:Hypothetical protein A7982_01934 [Minicystis rosea]